MPDDPHPAIAFRCNSGSGIMSNNNHHNPNWLAELEAWNAKLKARRTYPMDKPAVADNLNPVQDIDPLEDTHEWMRSLLSGGSGLNGRKAS